MTETKSAKHQSSPAPKVSRRERAAIRSYSGALALFVDDRPRAPIILNASTGGAPSDISSAVDKGFGLIRIDLDDLCWPAGNQLDAAAVDAALQHLIGLPSTYRFLLSIRVDAPEWWLDSNPKERAEYARRRDAVSQSPHPPVSFASAKWLKSAADALERLLQYVLKSDAGSCLIGVQILAGEAGAWIYPDTDRMPDIGPCMTTAFIKYTVDKYRRNEGLLRKAWFDTRAEFSTIRCPTAVEREKAEFGLFRNPHRTRKLMDYYECLANVQADAALSFCTLVKRISARSILVGLESAPLTNGTATPECGHTFPDQLLTSSDVDFFVETDVKSSSMPASSSRYGVFRPYRDSAALHGKFVFLHSGVNGSGEGVSASYYAAADGVGAIVEAPRSEQDLLDMANLASGWEKRLSRPHKPQTQIALIMDPSAGLVVSQRPDGIPIHSLVLDQIDLLRRAGIVFSIFSMGDMFHPKFPDHKVVLFPNCFYLSEPERRKLDARIKRSGQTAVWFWCPGIIGEEGINAEEGTKCCGQKIRIESTDISLRTRIVDSNDPLTWGRHAGDVFGLELPASPRCTVADSKASRLGANSDNKTSFSVRRFDTWTSVVYGTLPVPLDLLQNLFRSAACHVYCSTLRSGDRLASDGRTLCLASRVGGTYTLFLPGQFDVMDLASGKKIGSGVSEIVVSLVIGQSALYELRLRPKERP
jgi:hypothetical protein